MARFVSQFKGFTHGVRPGKPSHLGLDGIMVPESRELEAVFHHNLVSPADVEAAKLYLANPDPAKSDFRGSVQDEAGREIEISHRLAVYDSEFHKLHEGLTDEEEALCVKKLRESSFNGRGSSFVEVEEKSIKRPWANYDDVLDPQKVLAIAESVGADLEVLLKYEQQNQNRPEFIAVFDKVVEEEKDEVVVNA
jgi:hypothetical protein